LSLVETPLSSCVRRQHGVVLPGEGKWFVLSLGCGVHPSINQSIGNLILKPRVKIKAIKGTPRQASTETAITAEKIDRDSVTHDCNLEKINKIESCRKMDHNRNYKKCLFDTLAMYWPVMLIHWWWMDLRKARS
jgi:hypothetical protein